MGPGWEHCGYNWVFSTTGIAFDMEVNQSWLKTQLNFPKNTELSSGHQDLRWNLISSNVFRREGGGLVAGTWAGQMREGRKILMSHLEERVLEGH